MKAVRQFALNIKNKVMGFEDVTDRVPAPTPKNTIENLRTFLKATSELELDKLTIAHNTHSKILEILNSVSTELNKNLSLNIVQDNNTLVVDNSTNAKSLKKYALEIYNSIDNSGVVNIAENQSNPIHNNEDFFLDMGACGSVLDYENKEVDTQNTKNAAVLLSLVTLAKIAQEISDYNDKDFPSARETHDGILAALIKASIILQKAEGVDFITIPILSNDNNNNVVALKNLARTIHSNATQIAANGEKITTLLIADSDANGVLIKQNKDLSAQSETLATNTKFRKALADLASNVQGIVDRRSDDLAAAYREHKDIKTALKNALETLGYEEFESESEDQEETKESDKTFISVTLFEGDHDKNAKNLIKAAVMIARNIGNIAGDHEQIVDILGDDEYLRKVAEENAEFANINAAVTAQITANSPVKTALKTLATHVQNIVKLNTEDLDAAHTTHKSIIDTLNNVRDILGQSGATVTGTALGEDSDATAIKDNATAIQTAIGGITGAQITTLLGNDVNTISNINTKATDLSKQNAAVTAQITANALVKTALKTLATHVLDASQHNFDELATIHKNSICNTLNAVRDILVKSGATVTGTALGEDSDAAAIKDNATAIQTAIGGITGAQITTLLGNDTNTIANITIQDTALSEQNAKVTAQIQKNKDFKSAVDHLKSAVKDIADITPDKLIIANNIHDDIHQCLVGAQKILVKCGIIVDEVPDLMSDVDHKVNAAALIKAANEIASKTTGEITGQDITSLLMTVSNATDNINAYAVKLGDANSKVPQLLAKQVASVRKSFSELSIVANVVTAFGDELEDANTTYDGICKSITNAVNILSRGGIEISVSKDVNAANIRSDAKNIATVTAINAVDDAGIIKLLAANDTGVVGKIRQISIDIGVESKRIQEVAILNSARDSIVTSLNNLDEDGIKRFDSDQSKLNAYDALNSVAKIISDITISDITGDTLDAQLANNKKPTEQELIARRDVVLKAAKAMKGSVREDNGNVDYAYSLNEAVKPISLVTYASADKDYITKLLTGFNAEHIKQITLPDDQKQLNDIYNAINSVADFIGGITGKKLDAAALIKNDTPTAEEAIFRYNLVLNAATAQVQDINKLTKGCLNNKKEVCDALDSANAKIIKKPIRKYLSESYGLSGVKELKKSGSKYTITFDSPKSREEFAVMFNSHGTDLGLLNDGRKKTVVFDVNENKSLEDYLKSRAKEGRFSSKFDQKNLAYQNKALDKARTPFLSKAVRATVGGFGIVPTVFTVTGRSLAFVHNDLGFRHIPIAGVGISLLATASMRVSNLFDGIGIFSEENEKIIERVHTEQKKAQDTRNKPFFQRNWARVCKTCSTPFALFGIVSLAGRSGGDFVKTIGDGIINTTKEIPIIGNIFGVQGVGGAVREVGRLVSETSNVLDVQHFGRSSGVIGGVGDVDFGFQKGMHRVEKKTREFGEDPLKIIRTTPSILSLKVPEAVQKEKISKILYDSKSCACAVVGEYDLGNGLRAIKILKWDNKGNFQEGEKGFDYKYMNGTLLLEEKDVSKAQRVELATLDYSPSLSKDSISIEEYKKIVSGKDRDVFKDVKDAAMKIQGTDYEVKKNGSAIEFYKSGSGVKMEFLDNDTIDISLLKVVQKLKNKELSFVPASPRPSPSSIISVTQLNSQEQSRGG